MKEAVHVAGSQWKIQYETVIENSVFLYGLVSAAWLLSSLPMSVIYDRATRNAYQLNNFLCRLDVRYFPILIDLQVSNWY